MNHLILLGILALTLGYSIKGLARSPAVLPTIGISIDHVKSPPPSKLKNPGYEFTQNAQPKQLVQAGTTAQAFKFPAENDLNQNANRRNGAMTMRTLPLAMTFIILSFPLIAWLYLNQKREDEEFPMAPAEVTPGNTVSLAERRERMEEEQNRKNFIQQNGQDSDKNKISKKAS